MDNDDALVGRLLSRREVLVLFGAAGAALAVACSSDSKSTATATRPASSTPANVATKGAATQAPAAGTSASTSAPSCIVRPEMTEGPYFVDEKLNRSDIRIEPSDSSVKEGAPIALAFNVSQVGSAGACTALSGATIDVWHCDAAGVYSDVSDPGFQTTGKKFLRGYQTTDANGQTKFTTIYPGWYQGRTVHIHFKIRTSSGHEFTSQLFFDDSLTDAVHAKAPYASKGQRTLRNTSDNIYNGGGDQLLLALTPSGDGCATTFDIGLQF